MVNPTKPPSQPKDNQGYQTEFFDRYYKEGWDSSLDVKGRSQSQGRMSTVGFEPFVFENTKKLPFAHMPTSVPDFLRFAVPMEPSASISDRMDVVLPSYTNARYE